MVFLVRLLEPNWWGNYGDPELAPYRLFSSRPNTGRFKVSADPVLVYTKSGHPAWQMMITSLNADTSVTGVLLFDARDDRARFYPILAGTATEDQVVKTFEGINQNVRGDWKARHLSMHKIYGTATWVASFVLDKGEVVSKGEPYQGILMVPAHDLQGSNVVYSTNKETALSNYRQLLARAPKTDAPEENSLKREVKGTVKEIASQIDNGNTVYLIILNEDKRVFKASKNISLELPFAKPGDSVIISFIDVSNSPNQAYDVSDFSDLTSSVVP